MQEEYAWSWSITAAFQRGRRLIPCLLLVPLMIVASLSNAHARESSASGSAASTWQFSVSPYLWAAGLSGKAGTLPGLPPADVDTSFGDIWDDLDFAGMVLMGAHQGRFSIVSDLQYVVTSAQNNSLAPLFDKEKLTSKTFGFYLGGEYALYEERGASLRLAGGLRLWSVDTELKLSSGLLPGRELNGNDTWVDPVIGLRGSIDVFSRVFLMGWGFVGGFGAGSDIMADLFGGVGYRFADWISTTIGYRWMKVDRDRDDFLYDVIQQGLMVGVTFRF